MNNLLASLMATLVVGSAAGCASWPDAENSVVVGEQMVAAAYPEMPPELVARAVQDAQQKACSEAAIAKLSAEDASALVEAARATLKYPPSGKLIGDWRRGEQLVSNGAGMRIREGRVEPVKQNGALCTNCHALDKNDVNVGNLGPSLVGYGNQRGNSDAVIKFTYEKIYNAWLYFPCSNMPRLGNNGYLTPDQIADVVAYLIAAESPVNSR
jgi:L-cysteine S-thiosulfotransferase